MLLSGGPDTNSTSVGGPGAIIHRYHPSTGKANERSHIMRFQAHGDSKENRILVSDEKSFRSKCRTDGTRSRVIPNCLVSSHLLLFMGRGTQYVIGSVNEQDIGRPRPGIGDSRA